MSAARQKNDPRRRGRLKPVVVLTLGLTLLLTACGRNMFDQAKVEPFEASTYFDDGAGMQVPPPNAISRERGGLDPSFLSGQGAQGRSGGTAMVTRLTGRIKPQFLPSLAISAIRSPVRPASNRGARRSNMAEETS